VSDKQAKKNPYEYPCPVCQGDAFTWGQLVGGESFVPGMLSRGIGFQPDKAKVTEILNGNPIRIRRCDRCSNLQLFSMVSSAE
jgi:hypothetical protein